MDNPASPKSGPPSEADEAPKQSPIEVSDDQQEHEEPPQACALFNCVIAICGQQQLKESVAIPQARFIS